MTSSPGVEFVDLKRQYASIRDEIAAAIQAVLDDQVFILGPKVKTFEVEFAKAQEVPYCIGCSNGTSALKLAFHAIDLKPGDEVITVPNTFIATVEHIIELGAKPVFIDVRADTFLMDVDKLEKAITPKTKAIVPVHLYGQMAEMDRIRAIADKHKLIVIEDAAQAHLATYKGKRAGFYGDMATFSFYPGKNLGAYGDAGAVVTKDKALAERLFILRNHGRAPGSKYEHAFWGTNERMDDIQAAVLSVKLKHLPQWTTRRRAIATEYKKLLAHVGVTIPHEDAHAEHVWHLFVVESPHREALAKYLGEHGIHTGVHYPIPLHLQPALARFGYKKGDFPVAEHGCARILSLPLFAEMTDAECARVAEAVAQAARSHS